MKKLFILATLISTSAFGLEYGTEYFNILSNNMYDSCLDFVLDTAVKGGQKLSKDQLETTEKWCACQAFCVAEKTKDISFIFDEKAQNKLKKTHTRCMEKCNKVIKQQNN